MFSPIGVIDTTNDDGPDGELKRNMNEQDGKAVGYLE
jgi:hypothetical protein